MVETWKSTSFSVFFQSGNFQFSKQNNSNFKKKKKTFQILWQKNRCHLKIVMLTLMTRKIVLWLWMWYFFICETIEKFTIRLLNSKSQYIRQLLQMRWKNIKLLRLRFKKLPYKKNYLVYLNQFIFRTSLNIQFRRRSQTFFQKIYS